MGVQRCGWRSCWEIRVLLAGVAAVDPLRFQAVARTLQRVELLHREHVLMTAGLREMAVVASFFGVPEETAFGLSGAADLITTCISPHSRNRRLGAMLAQGLSMDGALERVGMTVEGVAMSRTIETLWTLDVSIPFIHLVNAVVLGKCRDVRQELVDLIAAF